MPTLHRLACFRDDIIFIIYLYQKWIYPVDSRRPNEFGQIGTKEEISTSDTTSLASIKNQVQNMETELKEKQDNRDMEDIVKEKKNIEKDIEGIRKRNVVSSESKK